MQPEIDSAAERAEATAGGAVRVFQIETGELSATRCGYRQIDAAAVVIRPVSLVFVVATEIVPVADAVRDCSFEHGKMQCVTGPQPELGRVVPPLIFINRIALPNAVTGGQRVPVKSKGCEYEHSTIQILTSQLGVEGIETGIGKAARLSGSCPVTIVKRSQFVPATIELRCGFGEFDFDVFAFAELAANTADLCSPR